MRYVKWIFVLLFFSSLTSFVDKEKPVTGLNVGNFAPNFEVKSNSGDHLFDLETLKGKYVLLSFWASYDANSRIEHIRLNQGLQNLEIPLEIVSICFDEYQSVFNETLIKDNISNPFCFLEIGGENSSIFRKYHLEKGFVNYLLDDKGQIVIKNFSLSELEDYFS